MAFLKTARGVLVHRDFSTQNWANFVGENRTRLANGPYRTASSSPNLVAQASEILGSEFNPDKYLLSHATIVASVDTEEVSNVKLGSVTESGRQINRKWSNYHITAETERFCNSNYDSWDRAVLLKSYRTFIGAESFCFAPDTKILMGDGTYRSIEDIRMGDDVISHTGVVRKVTHTFVRDYEGPIRAIYVDRFKKPILATGNHPFRAITVDAPPLTSYEKTTVSSQIRYRFDQITSALRDGVHAFGKTQQPLRKVKAFLLLNGPTLCGDISEALGHKRNHAPVILLRVLKRYPLQFESRPLDPHEYPTLKKGRTRARVWSVRKDAPDFPTTDVHTNKDWVNAEELTGGGYVLGPERVTGTVSNWGKATLLGYFLAEGCRLSPHKEYGVALSFGDHERNLVEHAAKLAEECFPGVRARIQKPSQGVLRVNIYGGDIDRWMTKHGGGYSDTKRIHSDVFSWDRETLLRMLAGWMAGDGDHHGGTLRLRGATVSKDLGEQMQRVAELCGIKSSLVFTRQRIGEVTNRIEMVIGGEPRMFDVIPRHHLWTVLVSKDSTTEIALRTIRWGTALHDVNAVRKRQEFAWWENCRAHRIASNDSIPYKGKVYNFEVEEDHSYVVTHGIAVHNCEHVQIAELSKGRIIDAVARDIGPSVYIDILIANDRKHTELIRDIESGRMSTLSMGCSVTDCQCTKCGNVAADETSMCPCIKYEKGNTFFDTRGVQRGVYELCGHSSIDPTGGVNFIEASWVATPAFTGAVVRNILEPETITVQTEEQIRKVLASPPREWSKTDGVTKAARLGFDFGEEPSETAPGSEPAPQAPENPFDGVEKELEQFILDNVKKRIKDKLQKKVEEKAISGENENGELGTSTGDSIIHQGSVIAWTPMQKRAAQYRTGLATLLRVAGSDIELMEHIARLNTRFGVKVSREIYRVGLRVGSTVSHPSLDGYLTACRQVLGRDPTAGEAKTLVRLGQLLALRS